MITTNRIAVLATVAAVLGASGCKGSKGEQGPAGSPGPTSTPSQPIITSVTPGIATANMAVTITGTNFSAVAAEDRVFIGGYEVPASSATATSIVVTPSFGSAIDENGYTDVSVVVNDQTSNSVLIQIVDPGTSLPLATNDLIPRTLVKAGADVYAGGIDSNNGSIWVNRIAADGTVAREIAPNNMLSQITRLIPKDATHFYILDRNNARLFEYETGSRDLTIVRQWTHDFVYANDAAFVGTDLYLLRNDGSSVDLLAADGTFSYGVASVGSCTGGANSIAQIAGILYFSGFNTICSVDPATPATVTPLTLSGDVPSSINHMQVDGANLLVAGAVASEAGAISVDTTGVATLLTGLVTSNSAVDAIPLGGGNYAIATSLEVVKSNLTTTTVLAPRLDQVIGIGRAGALTYVTTDGGDNGEFSSFTVINADGSYKVLATTPTYDDFFVQIKLGATSAMVTGGNQTDGTIDSINLTTGAVTPVVSGIAGGIIINFETDAAGNFIISQPGTVAQKLDSQGAVLDAAFITFANDTFHPMVKSGTNLIVADGSEIDSVPIATGGALTPVVTSGTVNHAPFCLVADKDGAIVYNDSSSGGIYRVTSEGFVEQVPGFTLTLQLSALPTGGFLAGDLISGYPAEILP